MWPTEANLVGGGGITSGIWSGDGSGWTLLPTESFPNEDTLHTLVENAPEMLPLSGSPRLVILGREVQLGSGSADLVAVETSGRPVVIEIKLGKNAEARRAVVAQLLAYASHLHGMTPGQAEEGPLRKHLSNAGFSTVLDAVKATDQERAIDESEFQRVLATSLDEGNFRLVLVLDEVPMELPRLVGYLETISDRITIDLITISVFKVNETQVVLPRRISGESELSVKTRPPKDPGSAETFDGSKEFEAHIDEVPEQNRALLRKLLNWARELEKQNLVRLYTSKGKAQRYTLVPKLPSYGAGLVTIWNENNAGYISLYRTMFERFAPELIERLEALIAPVKLGSGNTVRVISDELLDALTDAHQQAALGLRLG